MKKLIALAGACLLLASCSSPAPDASKDADLSQSTSISSSASASQSQEQEAAELFACLSEPFLFCSGVGAWSTTLSIAPDGSFAGEYHDSDMGVTGDGYPNGTKYICDFTGQFSQPTKVDDYTWSVQLESLTYDDALDTEEIRDGIRYILAAPYGLDGGEEFLIYLPGAPAADLPEGFLSWVDLQMDDWDSSQTGTLPFFGLYNVKTEEGFSADLPEEAAH